MRPIHGLGRARGFGRRPAFWALLLLLVGAGCAAAGATVGSGVGDTYLSRPPYYTGSWTAPLGSAVRIGHLPIAYQRGATQAPIFDPSLAAEMLSLLAEMNTFLDSLDVSLRLVEGGPVSAVTHAATLEPPDVQFGCATRSGRPDDDCLFEDDEDLGPQRRQMRLAVGRPSREWVTWMGEVMADQGAEVALVLTLEVGQYLIRQEGLAGKKMLDLGSSHAVHLPWLTSLETPVSVLQLTGAMVGPDGKALRVGAEGLMPHRTRIVVSGLGGQELVSDEDVAKLRTLRREDLAGRPLAWTVALRTMVERLAGPGGVR